MKKSFLAVLGVVLLAGSAMAGPRFGVHVNFGGYGCGPHTYAPPVCHAPGAAYCQPPVVYYRPAPVCYYRPVPVVYAPICRAPILNTVSFGWRR